jgi:hypothetical protein
MIEFTTLITLAILFLIFFRPGKTPPLESPLVIESPGLYHVTLAPQLNLAQPFIEKVIGRIGEQDEQAADCETEFFEVRDRNVKAHGQDFYLLAVSRRNGMLYFQAAHPSSADPAENFKTIREFSDGVLAPLPKGQFVRCEAIATAVARAAADGGIEVGILNQSMR